MLQYPQTTFPIPQVRLKTLRYTWQHCWNITQQGNWRAGNHWGQITENWSHPAKWLQWQNWWELELARDRKKKRQLPCDNCTVIDPTLKNDFGTSSDERILTLIVMVTFKLLRWTASNIMKREAGQRYSGKTRCVNDNKENNRGKPKKKRLKRWRRKNKVCCSHLECVKGLCWEVACSDAIDRKEKREEVGNREVEGEQLKKKGW